MKVTLFCRNVLGGFSIESVTANLAHSLPPEVEARVFTPRATNKGLWNKIRAVFEVIPQQADVNHITGDTHYYAYLLDPRRTIVTMWDCARLMNEELWPVQRAMLKFFWFTLPRLRCRYITTASSESRNNLQRYAGLNARDIIVIPPGIDPRFRRLTLSESQKREILRNPLGKKTVLHISVPMANKNLPRLLEALKNLDLLLVKVGKFMREDEQLIERHQIPYVQFTNASTETLVMIYNAADCLAFPSLTEGFGMPVLEAQQCGCPVITSKTSSLPEVAGDGALLVDPHSIDEIRSAVIAILAGGNKTDELRNRGFSNAQRFAWSAVAPAYCDLYKRVADRT